LNLHKTFCIPHGGGGPGVGPVAVREHLAAFLPGNPVTQDPQTSGAVSGAFYGSAGILPIPYAYIRMMSGEGLKLATEVAVLSANYIAKRLSVAYPILYTNENGMVAHECIIDLREITKRSGVSVDDVAKRLIDYGFHAPTMSFPVAGTLMIEPTESESVHELDRFIDAMLNIAAEISAIENGSQDYETSALHNAPHTAQALLASDTSADAKLLAGLPTGVNPRHKYWPPVGRIDGAYGDRNLTCTCLPIEELAADI
jgi:glycine dehydrogenase